MPAKKKTATTKKKAAPARRSRASTSYTRRIRLRPVFSFGAVDTTYDPDIFTDGTDMQQIVLRINGTFNVGTDESKGQYKQLLTKLRNNNSDRFKAFALALGKLGGNANNDLLGFIQNMPSQEQAAAAAAKAKQESDAKTMKKLEPISAEAKAEAQAKDRAAKQAQAAAKQAAAAQAAAQAAKSAGPAEAPAKLPSQSTSIPASSGNGGSGKGLALLTSVDNLTEGVNQTVTLLSKLTTVEEKLKNEISKLKQQLAEQGKKYTSLEQQHSGVTEKLAQAQKDHETALAAAQEEGNAAAAKAAAAAATAAAAHENALAEQKQKLEAAAEKVRIDGQKTANDLNQKLSGLTDLEDQVDQATKDLKVLEEQLETALKNVPPVFKGDIEVGDYVAEIMEKAASEVQQQFGISHRFKFGSCGRKMHVKKRRK